MTTTIRRRTERGFSLVEMLVALGILTIVLGVIFQQLRDVQVKYKSEEAKIDLTQEARTSLDQIARDLHQAGYPALKMFDSSLGLTSASSGVAAGLLNVSDTDLQFEGDVDGDGSVNVIHYKLVDDGSGLCPCTLVRSQTVKGAGAESFDPAAQNVVNSSASAPKDISGSSSTGSGTVSNDSLYGAYKRPSVFQAFDVDGNVIDGTVAANLQKIRNIRVTLNVLAPYASLDTRTRPAVSMAVNARVGNNF